MEEGPTGGGQGTKMGTEVLNIQRAQGGKGMWEENVHDRTEATEIEPPKDAAKETDFGNEPEAKPQLETENGPEAKPQLKAENGPEVKAQPEGGRPPEAEPQPEAGSRPEAESDTLTAGAEGGSENNGGSAPRGDGRILESLAEIGDRLSGQQDSMAKMQTEIREMHRLYHNEFAGRLKTMQEELEEYHEIDRGRVFDDILREIARIYSDNEGRNKQIC